MYFKYVFQLLVFQLLHNTGRIMTISLVSDITLKSSQVVCDWQTQYKMQYTHCWTAIYPCPVVNFHISGTKWASTGTRDTVGQFWDDPGHSGTVGKPICMRVSSPAFSSPRPFTSSRDLTYLDVCCVPPCLKAGVDVMAVFSSRL